MLYNVAQPQRAMEHHTAAHCLLPGGMGVGIGRVEVGKLVGSDKDSSTGKEKAMHISKAKEGIHSPLPTDKQVFSQL